MEDRFKFRAWDDHAKLMVDVDRIDIYENSLCIQAGCRELEIIDGNTLMQSTGRKDKNGKLVFEGDIAKVGTLNGYHKIKIYYEEKAQYFLFEYISVFEDDYLLGKVFRFCNCPDNVEVIGNVHENPELLEI